MAAEEGCDGRVQRERDFFAGWVVNPAGERIHWRREVASFLRVRPHGFGSVRSLACGRGSFEARPAEHADHALGIELPPEAIDDVKAAAAPRGIPNIEFVCSDVTPLELQWCFDTVVCLGFLHQLADDERRYLLARIRRHLRKGELLHTRDPNVHGVLRKVGRPALGSRHGDFHSDDGRQLEPAAARHFSLEAGFEKADLRHMDPCLKAGMQFFTEAPAWVMHGLALVDRPWWSPPVARWASGLAVEAVR